MRRTGFLSGFGFAAALAACRSPTEITVVVSTDLACSAHRASSITVGTLGAIDTSPPTASTSTTAACEPSKNTLGTLVIVPSGSDGAAFAFRVVLGVDRDPSECVGSAVAGCIVARRALRFLPHQQLIVNVALESACEGVVCPADQTCLRGRCVPAAVDPNACASPVGCGEGALPAPVLRADAGADSGDASAPGTSRDASIDSPADASDGASFAPSLALGEAHSCALQADGTVKCWGTNAAQQLGRGGGVDDANPASVLAGPGAALTGARALFAGFSDSCAILATGDVACWGLEADHELAQPGTANVAYATVIPPFAGATSIALGVTHTCFRGADGTPHCVGTDDFGQLGIGVSGPRASPVTPTNAFAVSWVSAGSISSFTLATRASDGSIWGWGTNGNGEITPGSSPVDPQPIPVFSGMALGPAVVELHVGGEYACARLADGTVTCWGADEFGQEGVPAGSGSTPTAIIDAQTQTKLTGALQLAVGGYHGCVRLTGGIVKCWGDDLHGQLGRGRPLDGGSAPSPEADAVLGISNAIDVACGVYHSCAMLANGQVWCWGQGSGYQLGQADGLEHSTPVRAL